MKNNDKNYMPKPQNGMLSFAITSTSNGQQAIFSINDEVGDIRNFAEGSDDRNFYKHLAFKEGKDQVVICVSHANDGCYMRILRYIPGRSGDNQEAWIFIPGNLVVPANDLGEIITLVKNAILDTKLTDHTEGLNNAFSKNYKIRQAYPLIKKSAEGKISYRLIPNDGIQSLLGDRLFESYYYDFEKVLFVDSETFNVVDSYEDISKNSFTKWVTISRSSIEPEVIVKVDDVELKNGMMVDSKQSHTIEYIKTDYLEPIVMRNAKILGDAQLPEKKLVFQYELKSSHFHISDIETGENLTENSQIKIDKIPFGDAGLFPESDLINGKLNISVKCFGYEDKAVNNKIQLPIEKPIRVQLKHKTSMYKFKIRAQYLSGAKDDAEFELEMKEKPSKSPLKSYVQKETSNNSFNLKPLPVIYPNWKFLLKVIIGALFFTCLGMGIGYYLWGMTQSSSAASSEESTEVVTDSLDQQSNTDSVEASEDNKKEGDSSSENKDESENKDNQNSQDTQEKNN